MRPFGLAIIFCVTLIPLYWFIPMANDWDVTPVISQFFGVSALLLMACIQILATRLPILETIFGGLDRIYVLHKWMGISTLAFVMLHDTIDAEIDGVNGGWLLDLAETLGENSLTALQVLLLISVVMLVPYHWWRQTHKLMGLVNILAVGHFIWIDKPFYNTDPLALYTLTFCLLGVIAYFYTLLNTFAPRHPLNRYRPYKLTHIEHTGGATAVTLTPQDKGISFAAGQFAFVTFDNKAIAESHPFTISQAPNKQEQLRFTIKNLGDYTQRLDTHITEGMTVRVQGGFGHFRLRCNKKASVWVAAGIGITPFLAWLDELSSGKTPTKNHPIDLFYCIKNPQSAPHLEELKNKVDTLQSDLSKKITLHIIDSSKGTRLSANMIIERTKEQWPNIRVSFCGPKAMRQSLKKDLCEKGLVRKGLFGKRLSTSSFVYEEFEIRSGVGIEPATKWALTHLWPIIQQRFSSWKHHHHLKRHLKNSSQNADQITKD